MTPETIQSLIEQSTRLIDTAALLPSDFIDRHALLRCADRRTHLLESEERDAKRKQAQLDKEFAMVNWATQAHLRLRTLLGTRLEEYGATLERSGTTLLLRANGWDRYMNDLDKYRGILANVEPFRFYTKRRQYRDEEIEGNFLNVTLAGKTSRHTNPNFPKIAASLVDAAPPPSSKNSASSFLFAKRSKPSIMATPPATRSSRGSNPLGSFPAAKFSRRTTNRSSTACG